MSRVYYKSDYKYVTTRRSEHQTSLRGFDVTTPWLKLWPDGRLSIVRGYAWDGCSGPTVDDRTNMRAGLVHDALYQAIRLGFIPLQKRKRVDLAFRRLLREDGMGAVRAQYYYAAVRAFGKSSALPTAERKELVAP